MRFIDPKFVLALDAKVLKLEDRSFGIWPKDATVSSNKKVSIIVNLEAKA